MTQIPELQPSGFIVLRAPALPFATLVDWAADVEAPGAAPTDLGHALARDRERLTERLAALLARPDVRAAVAVASADLSSALKDVAAPAQRAQEALVRYVSRMAGRPTPFGLFAGCGVGAIGERTRIELPEPSTWQRHTRLDADYLDALIEAFVNSPDLRRRLTVRPNDSLHRIGGRWRHVATRMEELERSYHLVEVADSPHLQRALQAAGEGAALADVARAVAGGGVDPDAGARYVDQLLDAQVLRSTLAPAVTGPRPLDALIADLEALGEARVVALLRAAAQELAAIDDADDADADGPHERLLAALAQLPVSAQRPHLLHVDLVIAAGDVTLARSAVDDIARGVQLLARIAPAPQPGELDEFRAAFGDRYGEREVPLLEALDEELGVGFGPREDPAPLLQDLRLPDRSGWDARMGARERRLLEMLHRVWDHGDAELALHAEDIAALERSDALPLPDAMAVCAMPAQTREGARLLITGTGGPSGARLLGRFCHVDPLLEACVREHVRAEEALDPEAVYAEVVHLPAGRLANVVARPVLREWEIEWLGRSGAEAQRRLPASDLLLSLRDDRFVLRSQRLGRRVVPRLSSAHNWRRRSPGVYRFLAAMQSDHVAGDVGWSWAPFHHAPFTPRVRWGRLVLARARWRVAGAELRALDVEDPVERWRAVGAWRERRRLPRWICLVEDDNLLPVDLDNVVAVEAFVRQVRRRDEILLEELFPGPDELVAHGPDGARAVEIVVPFVRAAPVGHRDGELGARSAATTSVARTFPPGSEWSFLKLYTGSATADRLLRDAIAPLARELIGSGAADSWFFLRYADPGFHLRVRVHGKAAEIRPRLERLAAAALAEGLAHDALLATYAREIERYGGPDGILVAERLFHADSDAVAELLGMFAAGAAGLDERWRIGLLGADRLMADLGLDDAGRAALVRRRRAEFDGELRSDAGLRRAIGKQARAWQPALEDLLAATAHADHPLAPGIGVLDERSERIAPLAVELARLRDAARLEIGAQELASSFVHMWLNRLARSENRLQEYVTYALLQRIHEARAGRAAGGC